MAKFAAAATFLAANAATIAAVGTAVSTVATVASLVGAFGDDGPGAPGAPVTPTTSQTERDVARRAAGDIQRRKAAASTGRRDTILTSPLGATGTVSTAKKTILGA